MDELNELENKLLKFIDTSWDLKHKITWRVIRRQYPERNIEDQIVFNKALMTLKIRGLITSKQFPNMSEVGLRSSKFGHDYIKSI